MRTYTYRLGHSQARALLRFRPARVTYSYPNNPVLIEGPVVLATDLGDAVGKTLLEAKPGDYIIHDIHWEGEK